VKKLILTIFIFLYSISFTFADQWGVSFANGENHIYRIDASGTETLKKSFTFNSGGWLSSKSYTDDLSGVLYLYDSGDNGYVTYDPATDTLTMDVPATYVSNYQALFPVVTPVTDIIENTTNNAGDAVTKIKTSILADSDGDALVESKADGSIHIGENSLVTIESGGRQQLYATDANGNRIDINIPSGTNLLIDGEDVMGSIDSSIALGAAFASLPTGAEGAGYTCGLGTGFHDSASAISGGCGFDFANYSFVDSMPELFQKASFNIGAASVVHGEGNDATLKAGITFKFGTPKPVREAKDDNLLLENKIDAVMAKNETIQAENDLLKAQISEINTQLKALNMLAMN